MKIYNCSRELIVETPDKQRGFLSGLRLPNADFSNLELECTFFGDCILTGATFAGADLYDAYLYRANCRDADFRGACLRGAVFDEADLTDANLAGADLSPNNMTTCTYLRAACLRGAILTGTNMTGALYSSETIFPDGFDPIQAGMILDEDSAG